MQYVLLFLTDGLLGYLLQGIGYLLGIYGFVRRKIKFREFAGMAVLFAVVAFGIRQISIISFGFHTILIMIACILLAMLLLHTPPFMTVIGVLVSSITILVAELICITVISQVIGYNDTMAIMAGTGTISARISKALLGTPTNLILIAAMYTFYRIRIKPKKERCRDGKVSEAGGTENR